MAKKAAAKKTAAKRTAAKKTASKKAAAKKAVAKKAAAKKAVAKKAAAKKAVAKKAAAKKAVAKRKAAAPGRAPSGGAPDPTTANRAKSAQGNVLPRTNSKSWSPTKAEAGAGTGGAANLDGKPAKRKKKIKTPLTAKQLRQFKATLLEKRAELTGDLLNMTDEALHRNGGAGAESSNVPIHLAERGSDNWEQEFTLGLIASEQAVIREIDEALERIDNRTYGICLGTEQPIALARLEAKPWAKYCIEYARLRDEGRV